VNLPNALTLSRIFVVPLLVVVLLTPVSENWLGVPQYILGVTIFVAAALTDYFFGGADFTGRESSRACVGGSNHRGPGIRGHRIALDCRY